MSNEETVVNVIDEDAMDYKMLEQMHKIAFQIVCDVDDFCRENNITYYLSGGSCLGAVREHGFIPWDHDADLMMPRKDYERFLVSFAERFKGKYKVGSLHTDENWLRQYSKIWDVNTRLQEKVFNEEERGISIDIFPIDGLPESAIARKIYYLRTKFYFKLRKLMSRKEVNPKSKFKFIKKLIIKKGGRAGSRKYAFKLENMAKKYDFDTSKYVGVSMACHYWDKETIERKYMSEPVYVTFEGRELPVVNGYDKYLTNLYGDYMKVPEDAVERQRKFMADNWDVSLNK